MGMLSDFSPKRTRNKGNELRGSNTKLPEVRSSPVQEIKHVEQNQELINKYAYHPEIEPEVCSKGASAQEEHKNNSQDQTTQNIKCPPFGLYELLPMCEEHLLIYLHGVQDPGLQKIQNLNKEYQYRKLEMLAESKKEVIFGAFKDNLFYYRGEVLITEDFLRLSGFLREYFDIDKVAVIYNTGEILLQETGYCNFWFKDRLNKFFNGLRELNHIEIQNDLNCLDCLYNYNCPFSRMDNITK
jgi:hypothetical protein